MWKPGNCKSVVSDTPEVGTHNDPRDVEFYGGYLVCESTLPATEPVLCVAKEALEVCRLLVSTSGPPYPGAIHALNAAACLAEETMARYKELVDAQTPAAPDTTESFRGTCREVAELYRVRPPQESV